VAVTSATTSRTGSSPLGFSRTPHLVELVAEAERLAAALAAAAGSARASLAVRTADAATLATLRLDGAELDELPATDDLPADPTYLAASAADDRPGTWLDAMRTLRDDPDEAVQALETAGVRAADASLDLQDRLLTAPSGALAELHRRLTRGLVAPEVAGAPRRSDQAVHDASTGRVLYFPTEPAAIAGEMALLDAWLTSAAAREHALVISGMLHLELLRIHPFEAANGRLARAAARLVLRGRGLDPAGLAAPELSLAADALGYHEEVARTRRRRDATIWLERWGEAVTDGLRDAARELDLLPSDLAARPARFLDGREDDAFTVADYRAEAEVGPEDARAELRQLLDAGAVDRVPGSRGLRFLRRR
jgi:fido (protein-threonine AMPylation protein)